MARTRLETVASGAPRERRGAEFVLPPGLRNRVELPYAHAGRGVQCRLEAGTLALPGDASAAWRTTTEVFCT